MEDSRVHVEEGIKIFARAALVCFLKGVEDVVWRTNEG